MKGNNDEKMQLSRKRSVIGKWFNSFSRREADATRVLYLCALASQKMAMRIIKEKR